MNVDKYAEQALKICLGMGESDATFVITDRATESLGRRFHQIAARVAPQREHSIVVMEDLGERRVDAPLTFPESVRQGIASADISLYAAQGGPGELASFRIPLLNAVTTDGKVRHGHMPNVSAEILELGFGADYQRVVDLTRRLFEKVQGAKTARVESALGTALNVTFNPNYRWVASDAIIGPGEFGNIPSGEVFTCVGGCEGTLVIDGEVGDHLCAKHGILADNPVTIEIADDRVKDIKCEKSELVSDLEEYFQIDENANRVGEFAIGTNINLKRFVGNLLLDEKFPGMHVAFGSGYPSKTGADWDGKAHLDCIVTKPTIRIDDKLIMDFGEFVFD